jgi:PAS domain S-box-containing protein
MQVQSIPSAAAGASSRPPETDYDRLFRLSLDLICVAGLDGYFKRVNPSWTRVLGWSEEELLSRPIHDFMHPDDRERTLHARAALAAGRPLRDFENRYLCKDGSYRWLAWQSVTEPGAPLVFAVARDITERREMDHERLVVSKLESTGILAAGIAHDFNNLLASLLLNVEMVGLCGPMTPKQAQFLEQARQTVLSAKTLTQQLLTVAGPDASSRRTQPIDELVRQAAELVLRDAPILSECRIAPGLAQVRVSETQLTQVLRGLILNALEATPPGGRVIVSAENTGPAKPVPAELPPGDYVCVTIADTGSGIPPEVRPKIFDPYFSTKTRGTQKGMGLGLTICRALIKRHGGVLMIDSQPGQGTTVSFYLPAAMRDLLP